MIMRPFDSIRSRVAAEVEEDRTVDAATVLENLIQLDRMLDEGSRRELASIPYLELSKHVRIRPAKG